MAAKRPALNEVYFKQCNRADRENYLCHLMLMYCLIMIINGEIDCAPIF